ncbi:MBL fold metallo-hydrolase [Nocardia sp. CA-128927]|uniref:MBL fold metallo-hydrolase n=1 Tax=Nocardia sp. CA-128927 TaxID=3239975 RepID=UPI003D9939F2
MANFAIDQAERLRRPGQIRSIHLGDTKVSFVPDGAIQGRPRSWLPDATDAMWDAHQRYLDDSGYLVASIGGLLVENGDRALLIDAGFGPQSLPAEPGSPNGAIRSGALLDNLAVLGRRPEHIEAVAFTHLHSDHVGWACHLAPDSDRPAFAHANYLVAEPEWDSRGPTDIEIATAFASRLRTVTDGEEVFPGVRIRITAGHTPGHAEYRISSGGQRVIAFGDALHSPIQADHPEWSCIYDHDPVRAAEHRHRLLAELEEPGTIGFGIHFADAVFGRVSRDGSGPAWRPLHI